jgi:hypothetical protein
MRRQREADKARRPALSSSPAPGLDPGAGVLDGREANGNVLEPTRKEAKETIS